MRYSRAFLILFFAIFCLPVLATPRTLDTIKKLKVSLMYVWAIWSLILVVVSPLKAIDLKNAF